MARVIEILKSEEKTIVHKSCGAKIGYYQIEVKNKVVHDYGGGSDTVYYLTCPNCGTEIVIS